MPIQRRSKQRKAGRPRFIPDPVQVATYVPAEIASRIKQAGGGNMAQGLREAIYTYLEEPISPLYDSESPI